jgi:hypothetical protein
MTSGLPDRSTWRILAVVVGRDDVAHVALLGRQHDAAPIDLRDLGHPPDDGLQDLAHVEAGRERLRQLEHHLRVALSLRDRLDVLPEPELPPDARHQLGRPERLAQEVVCARLERARHLVLGVERRQHDHRHLGRLGPPTERAHHLVAVGLGHHQIEQHEAGSVLLDPAQRLGTRRDEHALERGSPQRGGEDMTADSVVVDDQDGRSACHALTSVAGPCPALQLF